MIKNIIFDIGEVLIDFSWREHMQELGFSESTIEALGKGWVCSPLWDELDRGAMPEEEALALAKAALPEYEKEIDTFWSNPDGIVRCRKRSAPWLRSLRERGYNVYLLSNYPHTLFEAHQKDFEFLPYTNGRVVSSYLGIMKPDRRIYEELLSKYSLDAEECIFIDDRQVNLDGAQALKINTLLFRNMQQAIDELDKMLSE